MCIYMSWCTSQGLLSLDRKCPQTTIILYWVRCFTFTSDVLVSLFFFNAKAIKLKDFMVVICIFLNLFYSFLFWFIQRRWYEINVIFGYFIIRLSWLYFQHLLWILSSVITTFYFFTFKDESYICIGLFLYYVSCVHYDLGRVYMIQIWQIERITQRQLEE